MILEFYVAAPTRTLTLCKVLRLLYSKKSHPPSTMCARNSRTYVHHFPFNVARLAENLPVDHGRPRSWVANISKSRVKVLIRWPPWRAGERWHSSCDEIILIVFIWLISSYDLNLFQFHLGFLHFSMTCNLTFRIQDVISMRYVPFCNMSRSYSPMVSHAHGWAYS